MLLYQCQKTRDSRDNNVCSKYFSISEGGSKVGHPLPPPKYHKAVPSGTCNLICISHVLQQQAPFSLSCLCSARNNIQICSREAVSERVASLSYWDILASSLIFLLNSSFKIKVLLFLRRKLEIYGAVPVCKSWKRQCMGKYSVKHLSFNL